MHTAKPIHQIDIPDEDSLYIHTAFSDASVLTVRGRKPGVTRLTLTDVDGKKEEVVAVVAGKAK
jgi:hypothetical protein